MSDEDASFLQSAAADLSQLDLADKSRLRYLALTKL
jgi:hypothetical protein